MALICQKLKIGIGMKNKDKQKRVCNKADSCFFIIKSCNTKISTKMLNPFKYS